MDVKKININQSEQTYYIASTASAVSYDNSTSGLEAVNAQGALDELKSNIIQEIERAQAAEQANATSIIGTDRIANEAVTRDKISFNDILNKSFVLNATPFFEQGEFNYNYDPIIFNDVLVRIRTVFNINAIKSISITNTEEFRIANAFITDSSFNLHSGSYKIIYVRATSIDILNSIKDITDFTLAYLVVSFSKIDYKTPISPSEADNMGLVVEPLNIVKEVNKINESIDNINKKASETHPKEIICFGDSLTAGDGVGEYPKELQNILGDGYSVINQGVGGETSHTILARLGSEVMYSHKDINFQLGSNSPVEIANGAELKIRLQAQL